ncbi:exopolysaccharide production repressor protein [Mesorhizobium sp. M1406]|uniref:exopolysaccharide production repressor protein n=1 Tax=Mesorhizobium sp. M1406 TaxID=2957099 RepID=UPI0033393FEF
MACWLLLQVAYFASVLFLIWRSGCASRARQGLGMHFISVVKRKADTSRQTM